MGYPTNEPILYNLFGLVVKTYIPIDMHNIKLLGLNSIYSVSMDRYKCMVKIFSLNHF